MKTFILKHKMIIAIAIILLTGVLFIVKNKGIDAETPATDSITTNSVIVTPTISISTTTVAIDTTIHSY